MHSTGGERAKNEGATNKASNPVLLAKMNKNLKHRMQLEEEATERVVVLDPEIERHTPPPVGSTTSRVFHVPSPCPRPRGGGNSLCQATGFSREFRVLA